MKNYTDTVASLSKTQTLSSHIKSLAKIELATEDARLKKYLSQCITTLQNEHAKDKAKSTPRSIAKVQHLHITQLLKYCNSLIPKKIPEWMIIAKRNGWTPPKK